MKFFDLIAPTNENDYAPLLLQKTASLLLCGLVICSFAITNIQSLWWQEFDWLVGAVLPAVVIEQTNEVRTAQTAPLLMRNALLDEAARLKAEDMAQNGYFAHYSPNGVSPWHWFDTVGYVYAQAGENLAVHFNDSKAVVAAWLESPTHRANIENDNYLEIGVGTAEGEYEGFKTIFVVQLFGTPAAPIQPIQKEVSIQSASASQTMDQEMVSTPIETAVLGETVTAPSPIQATEILDLDKQSIAPAEIAASIEPSKTQSSFTATSSTFTPVTVESLSFGSFIQSGSSASAGALATTPSTVLRYLYLSIGTLVAGMLLFSVVVAVRYQRPRQIAYGVGLLVLMSTLFYLQGRLTSTVVLANAEVLQTVIVVDTV